VRTENNRAIVLTIHHESRRRKTGLHQQPRTRNEVSQMEILGVIGGQDGLDRTEIGRGFSAQRRKGRREICLIRAQRNRLSFSLGDTAKTCPRKSGREVNTKKTFATSASLRLCVKSPARSWSAKAAYLTQPRSLLFRKSMICWTSLCVAASTATRSSFSFNVPLDFTRIL